MSISEWGKWWKLKQLAASIWRDVTVVPTVKLCYECDKPVEDERYDLCEKCDQPL